MDTLIICAAAIGLALWTTYLIKSSQRSASQTSDDQARLAEAVARTVREDIGKETERLRSAQSQQAVELRKELTDGLRESRTEIMGSLADTRRESAKSVADFSAETAEKTKELQKNVETALETTAAIAQIVVLVSEREGKRGQRLVAFCSLKPGMALTPEQLRAASFAVLPRYAVPDEIVILPTLPTLPSGKVDRQALRVPRGEPHA